MIRLIIQVIFLIAVMNTTIYIARLPDSEYHPIPTIVLGVFIAVYVISANKIKEF